MATLELDRKIKSALATWREKDYDPDFDDITWIEVFKPRKVQPGQAGEANHAQS